MDYPKVKVCLDTSEDNLIDELYTPCLKWAERFDRGVGYFTTGWLTYNVAGLSDFASRGGKMRLITSPILSTEDTDAIIGAENQDGSAFLRLEAALLENVEILKQEMEADIINTFSWMLYDGIIDMRFAIPCEKLEEGDFHDKFGIFYKGNDALSFSGSINDSKHGFQNYESIKVFKTWAGTQEYVDADTARFEKIWNRKDRNLKMFTIPQAVKNKIFELRSPDRPYSLPAGSSKWVHQDIAVKTFLEKEHGILAMATGTGKTVTAMKIINKLFDSGEIRRVVITMYGNDLLDQWAIQIRENYKNKQINYHYASQKMMKDFVMHPDDSVLILSRDARNLSKLLDLFDRLPGDYRNDTLFVFDEVHGAGSNTFVENLSDRLSPYRYRLGLSATPEREYDEAGNDFLLNEIGEVIFEFTLQDAIQKGILCEFNYIPLPYVLSDEEKNKFIQFDVYYCCALIGMAADQIDEDTSELKDIVEKYPVQYRDCKAQIAGLLVASEARRLGIDTQSPKLEQIMLQYLSNNDTLLSEDGIKTLNAYALKGYRLITDYPLFDKPTSREEFLDAFNVAMQFYEKKDS